MEPFEKRDFFGLKFDKRKKLKVFHQGIYGYILFHSTLSEKTLPKAMCIQ